MPEPGTVLVTGASGFVGTHVSAALAHAGWRVRGLVRPGSGPLPPGVGRAVADGLDDRRGVRAALAGARAVVHLAARVHVMRDASRDPLAEFRRVNVEGTRALAADAAAAGASSFVFASSVKALGESSGGCCLTDDTEPRPVDPYGVSKLEAERALADPSVAGAMRVTSLRLPLVYGPGVGGNMLRLLRLLERGVPLPLGRVRNRRSLAYVGNVAAAVRAVLEAPAAAGERFLVSDGEDLSTPALLRLLAGALGRPARLLPVPVWAMRAAGRAGDVLARAVPFPVTTPAVDRLLGSLCVDSSRLRERTGWRPPYTPAEGMAALAAWYRAPGSATP